MSFNNKAIEKMVKYFRQFTEIFCKKQVVLVLRWICERDEYLFFWQMFYMWDIFMLFPNEFMYFFMEVYCI